MKEIEFNAALDCRGGVHMTGLVFKQGPDGLLQVAKVRPGGSAAGVLQPGDVLLGCSAVVMVEDDAGDFLPERRWHDATEAAPEHTLAVLMTHGGEAAGEGEEGSQTGLEVYVCRHYVPRLDKVGPGGRPVGRSLRFALRTSPSNSAGNDKKDFFFF